MPARLALLITLFSTSGSDGPGVNATDITRTAGSDVLFGALDANLIIGLDGDDRIRAGGGNGTVLAGDGDDTIEGGRGGDAIDGGAGVQISVGASGAVTVRLGDGYGVGGRAQGDTYFSIENVVGSDQGDRLIGANAIDNILSGRAGDDSLAGLSGADTLIGGTGFDTAEYSGSGQRVVVRLWNGTGVGGDASGDTPDAIETVIGTAFNDVLIDAIGADNHLAGGEGADYLAGLAGSDTLIGGVGDDTLQGGVGVDHLVFAAGDGQDLVLDFEDGTDRIRIDGAATDMSGVTVTPDGSDTRITVADVVITLQGVESSLIDGTDFDFIV